jgi:uncharacterized membrane protein
MKFIKKEYVLSAFMLIFGLAMVSNTAVAQTTEAETEAVAAATISGEVVDEASQEAVVGAEVKISADNSATTDEEGKFSIDSLEPGLYTVTVEADGYESWSQEVTLEGDKELEIALTPSEG